MSSKSGQSIDPRHAAVRAEIAKLYEATNGVPVPWDGHTARVLSTWLRVNRGWKLDVILRCVWNRFDSDNINPADPPSLWIKFLPRYLRPLDQFGRPRFQRDPEAVRKREREEYKAAQERARKALEMEGKL
jgi:hypothetical protein